MTKVNTTTTSQADTATASPAVHVYISLFLNAARHAETLGRMRDQNRNGAEWIALWDGARALQCEAQDFAIKVRDYGLLPFAFDGSTVLKNGGAA